MLSKIALPSNSVIRAALKARRKKASNLPVSSKCVYIFHLEHFIPLPCCQQFLNLCHMLRRDRLSSQTAVLTAIDACESLNDMFHSTVLVSKVTQLYNASCFLLN